MPTVVGPAPFVPARELPNGAPFYSAELGILPYQADEVGAIIERTAPGADDGHITVHDTGMGKTIISLCAGAYLFHGGEIDLMVAIAEPGMLDDWLGAVEKHTNLAGLIYHGPKRHERLAVAEQVHVLITTYETAARDLIAPRTRTGAGGLRPRVEGSLFDELGLYRSRTFWSMDEFGKLKNRSSGLHKNWDWILTKRLRKRAPHQRVVGLTATPLSTDLSDAYNQMRIATPTVAPSVEDFKTNYVSGWDDNGRPVFEREDEERFAKLFQSISSRKAKTDPDVARYFPAKHESASHVEMTEPQIELYEAVRTVFEPEHGQSDMRKPNQIIADEKRLITFLRITTGHPAGHLHAKNDISKGIAEVYGPERLREIGSPKVDALIRRIEPFRARGWPVVVFTFFDVVLTELMLELDARGITHTEFRGSQSRTQNVKAKQLFSLGNTEVLLCTDAAARGQSFLASPSVVEYEAPFTYERRVQRINRVDRLTSPWSDVYAHLLVVSDTIEDGVANVVLKRNARQDVLLGDEESDDSTFISAATRRELLNIHPRRRARERSERAA